MIKGAAGASAGTGISPRRRARQSSPDDPQQRHHRPRRPQPHAHVRGVDVVPALDQPPLLRLKVLLRARRPRRLLHGDRSPHEREPDEQALRARARVERRGELESVHRVETLRRGGVHRRQLKLKGVEGGD
eukprot:31142-Pelagococcus_subviridis.AAC.11